MAKVNRFKVTYRAFKAHTVRGMDARGREKKEGKPATTVTFAYVLWFNSLCHLKFNFIALKRELFEKYKKLDDDYGVIKCVTPLCVLFWSCCCWRWRWWWWWCWSISSVCMIDVVRNDVCVYTWMSVFHYHLVAFSITNQAYVLKPVDMSEK